MNIILDTHAFLWFVDDNPRLSGNARALIESEDTHALVTLPFHHRDPFDRLIAVQAKIEKLALVSTDHSFDAYEIQRIW
jgi:PIN domain nuclease of toxin-antitoxin system